MAWQVIYVVFLQQGWNIFFSTHLGHLIYPRFPVTNVLEWSILSLFSHKIHLSIIFYSQTPHNPYLSVDGPVHGLWGVSLKIDSKDCQRIIKILEKYKGLQVHVELCY